jgi:hypothetical protein
LELHAGMNYNVHAAEIKIGIASKSGSEKEIENNASPILPKSIRIQK